MGLELYAKVAAKRVASLLEISVSLASQKYLALYENFHFQILFLLHQKATELATTIV